MLNIIRDIIIQLIWNVLLDKLTKGEYRQLINRLTVSFSITPLRQLVRLYWDILFDRINDTWLIRYNLTPTAVNPNVLFDSNKKNLFWLSLIFTFIIQRWLVLFKKIILWPFKLGIFSFFYSIFGIDMSWFLNIFDFFTFNIPQWVYIQYLTLYNNWLGWWNSSVNIKNLKSIDLPEKLDKSKINLNLDESLDSNLDDSDNKYN